MDLGQMFEQGYITQAEYDQAMAEQIQVVTYDNSSDTTQKATLSYLRLCPGKRSFKI